MRTCDLRYRIYTMAGRQPLGPGWVRRGEPGWRPPPACVGLAAVLGERLRWVDACREVVRRAAAPLSGAELLTALRAVRAAAGSPAGLVLDVHAQRYLTLREVERLAAQAEPNLVDHLVVHRTGVGPAVSLHTHGLAKFGHPDLVLPRLPGADVRLGAGLLLDVAAAMARGMELEPGDIVDVGPGYLRVAAGSPPPDGEDALYGRLELLNHDVITGEDRPDLGPFLAAVRRAERRTEVS